MPSGAVDPKTASTTDETPVHSITTSADAITVSIGPEW